MRLNPVRLFPAEHCIYYLYGEDEDAIFEAAEALLAEGVPDAIRIRVDVNELAVIEQESRNQGLFGPSVCYALVRNAQSASPKQGEHLLKLATSVSENNRVIICAPGVDWKRALHKKLKSEAAIAECEFRKPDEASFFRWLESEIKKKQLNVSPDALLWMSESLFGMRLAAKQMIERLGWYDNGAGGEIGLDVISDLLGERAPGALEEWCHAVAMRSSSALTLVHRLLKEEQLAEVQMISWLGTRMQQILMYRWFQSQRDRSALQAARVFGDARRRVGDESRAWRGGELVLALQRIVEAEKLVKGATIEDRSVVIERLTLDLIEEGRLAA